MKSKVVDIAVFEDVVEEDCVALARMHLGRGSQKWEESEVGGVRSGLKDGSNAFSNAFTPLVMRGGRSTSSHHHCTSSHLKICFWEGGLTPCIGRVLVREVEEQREVAAVVVLNTPVVVRVVKLVRQGATTKGERGGEKSAATGI
jgi:hypothetical protein